ncbi:MAG: tetratricopeptide repeat protein [Planctomycetota bacterium]|jgi:tetratricopeptide (TPR) repeat protein
MMGARLRSLGLCVFAGGALLVSSGCATELREEGEAPLGKMQTAMETDYFFQRALEVREEGHTEQAALYCRRALGRDPGHGAARGVLAEILIERGEFHRVVSLYADAVERFPDDSEHHFALGAACQASGDFDRARVSYQAASNLEPASSDALLMLGQLELIRGDVAAASLALEAAAGRTPQSPAVWVALGEVAEISGDPSRAASSYGKAVEVAPGEGAGLHALALLHHGQGDDAALLDLVDRYRAIWPADPAGAQAAALVGRCALRSERSEQAADLLQVAVKGGVDDSDHVFMLGEALRRIDEPLRAQAMFNRAVSARPDRALYHLGLGRALITLGKRDAAVQSLRRALRLKPEATYIQDYLDEARALAEEAG